METKENSFQFFLAKIISDERVIRIVNSMLQEKVESLNYRVVNAKGYAIATGYTDGYPQGWLLAWPADCVFSINCDELCMKLMKCLGVDVLYPNEDNSL